MYLFLIIIYIYLRVIKIRDRVEFPYPVFYVKINPFVLGSFQQTVLLIVLRIQWMQPTRRCKYGF